MTKDVNFMNEKERQSLIEYLFTEKCSCVIRKGNETRAFYERGVKDLYRLLKEDPEFLRGAFIADKVVGKAAAALMILGGVKEVFANVVSLPASELFGHAHIRAEYMQVVPHIINRTQTDWCPLEKRCADTVTPEACLPVIENFMMTLSEQTLSKN